MDDTAARIEPGHVHVFVYGTLRAGGSAADLLAGCERVREATVGGFLYDIDGGYPALLLYGATPVHGEIWRCPDDVLPRLDRYEGTPGGLFRRVALVVDGVPCWTYVAGPALARQLTPARRIDGGVWPPERRS